MAVAAVIVLAVIVYFWSFYRSHVVSVRNQDRLTFLVTQVPQKINDAMRRRAERRSIARPGVRRERSEGVRR